jgi:hypothetical protein
MNKVQPTFGAVREARFAGAAHRQTRTSDLLGARAFDEAQMSRSTTNCNRNFSRTCALGITWEGTPVPDFAGTVAVAAAMLFMLAVTLGLVSPSPRLVEAAQTIAQKN